MFGNTYFKALTTKTWVQKNWDGPLQFVEEGDREEFTMMLPSDMALLEDPVYRDWALRYARHEKLWMEDFGAAYSKLLHLGMTA
jgi:cytochrome c peroxidase